MIIPLAEWKPDLDAQAGGQTAQNVVPLAGGYGPWPTQSVLSSSLSSRCQGAFAASDKNDVNYNYAGDINSLFRLVDTTWTNASRATATGSYSYGTVSTDAWEFAQWGETAIAVNGSAVPQEITLGASVFNGLAGAPPVAKHIAIVRDFVWLGDLSATGLPQRVRWCAIGNSQSWTVDAATQADFQDLPGSGGRIQRIVGGEQALVFQQRALWRATYVGPPGIFDFGTGPLEKDVGALCKNSVASYGPYTFWLSERGFRMIAGAQGFAIGTDKVDKTFFADLDQANLDRVIGVIDPSRSIYLCAYPGTGNSGGNPNRIMVFNYQTQRWSLVLEDIQILFRYISTGYTLDGLDTITTNIDALSASLDDPAWSGGAYGLAAFNTSNQTALFTGAAKAASVDTLELELGREGRRASVTHARPLVDGSSSAISILTRNSKSDARSSSPALPQNTTGYVDARTNARYHAFQIQTSTSASFTNLLGVEVTAIADAGNR